jgi:hypothetical protein
MKPNCKSSGFIWFYPLLSEVICVRLKKDFEPGCYLLESVGYSERFCACGEPEEMKSDPCCYGEKEDLHPEEGNEEDGRGRDAQPEHGDGDDFRPSGDP